MRRRRRSKLEIRAGRSEHYWGKSPERQWEEDDEKGILDWDGTEEWLKKHGK